MNTGRVLFALNSEDPDIVAQGLEEFRGQILKDHDALEALVKVLFRPLSLIVNIRSVVC
jgi:hypothetical protein